MDNPYGNVFCEKYSIDDLIYKEIIKLLARKNRILAIKVLQKIAKLSLLEAKDAIYDLANKIYPEIYCPNVLIVDGDVRGYFDVDLLIYVTETIIKNGNYRKIEIKKGIYYE